MFHNWCSIIITIKFCKHTPSNAETRNNCLRSKTCITTLHQMKIGKYEYYYQLYRIYFLFKIVHINVAKKRRKSTFSSPLLLTIRHVEACCHACAYPISPDVGLCYIVCTRNNCCLFVQLVVFVYKLPLLFN